VVYAEGVDGISHAGTRAGFVLGARPIPVTSLTETGVPARRPDHATFTRTAGSALAEPAAARA
jgi:hypothetical protein